MSEIKFSNPTSSFKKFKDFDKPERDKIAEAVDSKHAELLLSPIVDGYVYGTNIALLAGDYFGSMDKKALWEHAVNKNADYFDITELEDNHPEKNIPRYLTFRSAAMYKDHQSQSLENAIGLIFDSILIKEPYDQMRVVNLFGIDSTKAPGIARILKTYPTRVATSMGCSIKHSICTICGHQVKKEADYCDCLRFTRGGRKNGKKVAEILKGVEFYEDSVVTAPACAPAMVLDAISEIVPGRLLKVASAMSDTYAYSQIMTTVYEMIKNANTLSEKKRLANNLDILIERLEKIVA